MSTRVDALRNTLDHLALDPTASEDRRYLVSMLRRLGYSDAEIEAQIGPLGGEGPRVIEVEYEPAEDRAPERPLSRETTFEVAAPDDGLSFRLSDDHAPAGAGVEEVHHTDLSGVESDLGDWGDDYEQGPRDDRTSVGDAPDDLDTDTDLAWGDDAPDTDLAWEDDARDRYSYGAEGPSEEAGQAEELVEFRVIKRPDPAVAAGWQEVGPPGEAPAEEPEASWAAPEESEWTGSGSDDAWAAPEAETGWSEAESEDAWAAPEAESAPEAETDLAAWPEAGPEEATEQAWPETGAPDEAGPEPAEELVPWPEASEPEAGAVPAWPEAPGEAGPEEAPEDAWPVEEAPTDAGTDEAPLREAPAAGQAWEETQPTEAWEDAGPADAWEDADAPTEAAEAPAAPYTHGDYTLHTRLVHLSTGREQRIYFFAKNKPQSGEPCALPDGYEVIENDKTGLPFLRRQR